MALKVTIPSGMTGVTVNGPHQWDYGQVLEITAPDIGSDVVEVHFACRSMTEAIVRPCAFTNGVGTVTLPDQCLEQTSPITAWIYRIDGFQGYTAATITMTITARPRPGAANEMPMGVADKYTELITEVNHSVNSLKEGDVTVAKALQADKATQANKATTAVSANSADEANTANFANAAGVLESEWEHVNTGNSVQLHSGVALPDMTLQVNGTYLFCIQDNTSAASCTVVFTHASEHYCNSSAANLLLTLENGTEKNAEVWLSYNNGKMFLMAFDRVDPLLPISENFRVTVSYKRIA